MGVTKIDSFRYECDRCERTDTYDTREEAKERGWLGFPADERLRRIRMLCPTCATKLDRFLMGEKTPAGCAFNRAEEERWDQSCGGMTGGFGG